MARGEDYLRKFLEKAKSPKAEHLFDLLPAANLDTMKVLQQHGVKAINLNACAYDVSLPATQRSGLVERVTGAVSDAMAPYLFADDTASEMKAREDLIIEVGIKLKGNTRAHIDAIEAIRTTAKTVVDDEGSVGGFTILTSKGEPVRSDNVRLSKVLTAEKQHQSVKYQDIFRGLRDYYVELRDSGLIEQ